MPMSASPLHSNSSSTYIRQQTIKAKVNSKRLKRVIKKTSFPEEIDHWKIPASFSVFFLNRSRTRELLLLRLAVLGVSSKTVAKFHPWAKTPRRFVLSDGPHMYKLTPSSNAPLNYFPFGLARAMSGRLLWLTRVSPYRSVHDAPS